MGLILEWQQADSQMEEQLLTLQASTNCPVLCMPSSILRKVEAIKVYANVNSI